MDKKAKILVLGSRGLVGSALVRQLKADGYEDILTPVREDLDLFVQADVLNYFQNNKPDYVFLAAARVGGIHANSTYKADFIWQNLAIEVNVFQAAFENKVKRLLFLGSSCIYPKHAPQPMKEEHLLTGPLEPTNEAYAVAKIAGLKMSQFFREQYGVEFYAVQPTNLYGVNDNFDPVNSHVIPGLIRRMTEAKNNGDKTFQVWGTGNPKREFLYVDDMAKACIHVMNYNGEIPNLINIGCGEDIAIKDLVTIIKNKVGYEGEIEFDTSKPDGAPRKLLDVSILKGMGWSPSISLEEGIEKSVEFFKANYS
jgi:GDP-L-fucose synthase